MNHRFQNKLLNPFNHKLADAFERLSIEDRYFVKTQIDNFPSQIQRILFKNYLQRNAGREANTYIRTLTPKLNALLPQAIVHLFDATEDDLRDASDDFAQRCKRIHIRSLRSVKTNLQLMTRYLYKPTKPVIDFARNLPSSMGLSRPL
jgi:hypothetical protein